MYRAVPRVSEIVGSTTILKIWPTDNSGANAPSTSDSFQPSAVRVSCLIRPGPAFRATATKIRSLRRRSGPIELIATPLPHSQSFVQPASGEPRHTCPVLVPRYYTGCSSRTRLLNAIVTVLPVLPQNG